MKPVAVVLGLAIASPALPARAAPPAGAEQSYRELAAATKLDLSREWAAYARAQQRDPFAKYVERRFRVRRDLGRGLLVTGAALLITSTFFLCFGVSTTGYERMNFGIAGATGGLGAGAMISGGALLGVYAKRLDRVHDATESSDVGLALRSGRLQLRGTGTGLQLAF